MGHPSSRTSRIAVAAATPVAIVAAAAMIWQSSNAAFTGSTRNSGNNWAAGAVALTDDDNGSARFQVQNMVPGQTDSKCLKVTANASVPGTVKGYAVNPTSSVHGLESRIKIAIQAGTGGGFGSCDGFTSEETLISGVTLGQLATVDTYEEGIGGWDVTAGTHSRTYRVTWTFDTTGMTQNQIDQLQGAQTGIDMQWELRSN
ncbi:hypothetical protein [Nocardioides antri]|uniref:Uncharacterized protein n=1 Tax=Nocardioides antri TaxID=2607659 RepID=A0A5B1M4H2_9ACTN|nr:hypothetical protein [Nocardioides antri]KAA1427556.1 hypothetical protein F0U47_08845 [Nocardioides antri]